ncbi:psiA family protein [Escherichia coli p0305293.1]|nr:psiA family protein [Escherichia coli p0305293.1]
MTARQNALVPLNAEQQAAWRAVAETEKRRHQGNTLAEYPYAGAFFRCLNGSRRISLSDLRFFMPSLTAEELRGNRSQWLYAVDVLIETQGEVCLLPLPGDAAEQLFPSVRFRVRERSRHKIRTGHAEVQPPAGTGGRAENPCVPGAGCSGRNRTGVPFAGNSRKLACTLE